MKKVLATMPDYFRLCPEMISLFKSHGIEVIEVNKGRTITVPELKEVIPGIDGVVAGSEPWNEEVFKYAKDLRIISRFGVGYDAVDLAKAKEYGIKVTNVKSQELSASVADHALALILSAERDIALQNESIRKGSWKGSICHTLRGRNIGLVGFGSIAQLVAKRAAGFEANIFACDKYPDNEKAKQLGVTIVSFEEILKNSDIISLHVPSSPETYHLIGKEQLYMMKKDAIIVNTSRGTIIDESALYEALKSKRIRAAAIDVFEKEPADADNPLFELDNIICTPHKAWNTYENIKATGLISAKAVIDALEGRDPENWLNP